ncbi:SIS domain-containing protein [Cryptosporangium aurantiacum]|uniref:Fructoselysine-6-P-deglycase FrlB with duplicated sugar isomerase (SIS) domain n=1 Tax=Cryptosporangium aurantiacum TaxID=134849 RepID=A0A1M7RBT9_9ACTN|nr:sugar isomerase [Cryptosporangium aurantiacum]SHN43599.1 Fructoselysine-6-P-deglycase FrlB with duplicated sugar isomerase (SIS) domain [Cryptosporangium aurantiacum]
MDATAREIASQPDVWERGLSLADEARAVLAAPGERTLILGCGTSWFVAQSLAELREAADLGETDAVCASEYVPRRRYDRVVAITRSGTSTEVLDALRVVPAGTRRVAVTAVTGEAVDDLVDDRLLLDFADETSVVQTRFPTTVLAAARAAYGEDLTGLLADGRDALAAPLPVDPAAVDHLVFLGTGWTVGLAHEAALKAREAAQAWSESYPARDYRHGPVAVAGERSLVWSFGAVPASLDDVARSAGATPYRDTRDPLAQLVLAQRFAVALAAHRGLDPDQPRLLTRSVVLTA